MEKFIENSKVKKLGPIFFLFCLSIFQISCGSNPPAPLPVPPPGANNNNLQTPQACVAINQPISYYGTGITLDSKLIAGVIPTTSSDAADAYAAPGTYGTLTLENKPFTSTPTSGLTTAYSTFNLLNGSQINFSTRSTTVKEVAGVLNLGPAVQASIVSQAGASTPGVVLCVTKLALSFDIHLPLFVKGRAYLTLNKALSGGKSGIYVDFN